MTETSPSVIGVAFALVLWITEGQWIQTLSCFRKLRAIFCGLFVLMLTGSIAFAADNDGDGLSNEVEADLGSDPNSKDIFVEIDWFAINSKDLKPRGNFVAVLESIFRGSFTPNPMRKERIKIHIELSDAIPDSRDAIGFMRPNGAYDWTEFDAVKQRYFTPSKRNTHHYCLFVKDIGDEQGRPLGISGLSRNKGNIRLGASEFMVALGGDYWYNYPTLGYYKWTQVGTFMHELGHNLGLKHGGIVDHIKYKPNHISVMNYAFQADGIPLDTDRGPFLDFNYAAGALPALNENSLNEQSGLGHLLTLVKIHGTEKCHMERSGTRGTAKNS